MSTTTLHIVSHLHEGRLPSALRRSLNPGDGLLLSGDAVYAALTSAADLPPRVAALQPDVVARGLFARWPDSIPLVDHGGFVDLCVQYDKSLSWS